MSLIESRQEREVVLAKLFSEGEYFNGKKEVLPSYNLPISSENTCLRYGPQSSVQKHFSGKFRRHFSYLDVLRSDNH